LVKSYARHTEIKASGKEVTLTAVQPLGRFGALEIDDTNTVTSFTEKPLGDGNYYKRVTFLTSFLSCDFLKKRVISEPMPDKQGLA
jgi:NDP-sugar pyrophosphorylase family protein